MNEFDLIKTYFAAQGDHRRDVRIGIGDDAAIVSLPEKHQLVVTTDTLVAGVHFPESATAHDIGYKSLAVNLSDLAAMGATPAWITLAITLPHSDEEWIQSFCSGFFTLANYHQVQLIGGDITHGPLSITVQAMGYVPNNQGLLRSNAKPGDLIYVTGTLGDAGLALRFIQNKIKLEPSKQRAILTRFHHPEPRIVTGKALLYIANSCIDISDGFAADLSHILEASGVGARINTSLLPLSDELVHSVSHDIAVELALTGGDDYELCFTIPPEKRDLLTTTLSTIACRYTHVGEITETPGLILTDKEGNEYHGEIHGYQHF